MLQWDSTHDRSVVVDSPPWRLIHGPQSSSGKQTYHRPVVRASDTGGRGRSSSRGRSRMFHATDPVHEQQHATDQHEVRRRKGDTHMVEQCVYGVVERGWDADQPGCRHVGGS